MDIVTPCPDLVLRPTPWHEGNGWLKHAFWKPVPDTIPAWPHPMRDTETDQAQAVADALDWYGMWLWE